MRILKHSMVCCTLIESNVRLHGQKSLCCNACEENHKGVLIRGRGSIFAIGFGRGRGGGGRTNLLGDRQNSARTTRCKMREGVPRNCAVTECVNT